MIGSLQITYYKGLLCSIKQKITNGEANIAKPILLLTIIRLIERGKVLGNKIVYNDVLKETYYAILKGYIVNDNTQQWTYVLKIVKGNDGFYHINGQTALKTPSEKYINEHIDYAYLDPELWDLLQDPLVRDEFRKAIINHYLKEEKE